jgi:hypothetical protein
MQIEELKTRNEDSERSKLRLQSLLQEANSQLEALRRNHEATVQQLRSTQAAHSSITDRASHLQATNDHLVHRLEVVVYRETLYYHPRLRLLSVGYSFYFRVYRCETR